VTILPREEIFRYELEISPDGDKNFVSLEKLSRSTNSKRFEVVFARKSSDGIVSEITASKKFDLKEGDPRREIRRNVSLISSLVQFDHKYARKVSEFFRTGIMTNLWPTKRKVDPDMVANFMGQNSEILDEFNKVVRVIDVGVERVEIVEEGRKKVPYFYHRGLCRPQRLEDESEGTKNFYTNFIDLFIALNSGGCAVMDELDSDLHPHLMREVVAWFHRDETNSFGAQLLMTCHNPTIIRDLTKEELWIAEKDDDGFTEVHRASEFEGLRRDANLYAKYLAGELGGVPRMG
jgi:hypothetical protein